MIALDPAVCLRSLQNKTACCLARRGTAGRRLNLCSADRLEHRAQCQHDQDQNSPGERGKAGNNDDRAPYG